MPHDAAAAAAVQFIEFDPKRHASTTRNAGPIGPIVQVRPASEYATQEIDWLWRGWLARGKVHLLAGTPGTGKTTIAVSLAAAISCGGRWPDGSDAPRGDVLIWSGEDGIADTLKPRLLASGGDASRVHFVDCVREHGKPRPFDPAKDMAGFVTAAKALPALKLVLLDPVVTAVTGDSHKNGEVRRGLQPVVDLAEELGCAVLGISHFAKSSSGREPLERVVGSIAFSAVARVVLATVKPADKHEPRRLVRAKSNLGPDTGGVEYQLISAPVPGHELTAQRVDWGKALEGSARELMAVEQPDAAAGAAADSEAFLLDTLKDGPVATKDIREAAAAHGHKPRTLDRAKKSLGVVAFKAKGALVGVWMWRLPTPNYANGCPEVRQRD